MNKTILKVLKAVGWVVLMLITFAFTALVPYTGSIYPLGKRLFLWKLSSRGPFEILLSDQGDRRDWSSGSALIPDNSSRHMDNGYTVGDYEVKKAACYSSYLLVWALNTQDGTRKYYIVDKTYDPETTAVDDILNDYMFETTDSLSFTARCRELGLKM